MAEEETNLAEKYRPKTLDEVIGQEAVVDRLKGIVKSGKWPSCIGFFGPPSAGKSTLARALATTVLGKSSKGNADFTEVSMGDNRTIDDIRGLIGTSKLRPVGGKRRLIFLDEAQALTGAPASMDALLVPTETPPKTTTWIFGSSDPEKLSSVQKGKALLTRIQQFHLKPYTDEQLSEQVTRIAQGEEMTFFTKSLRTTIVEGCNGEMRTLANMMQAVSQYYDGLKDKPEKLSADAVTEVLKAATADDEVTVVRFLTAVYARKYAAAHREILNIQDGFGSINRMLNMNWFLTSDCVLKGERHPKVWASKPALALRDNVKKVMGTDNATELLQAYGLVQTSLTRLKAQAQAFAVPDTMAMAQFAWETIQALKKTVKAEE